MSTSNDTLNPPEQARPSVSRRVLVKNAVANVANGASAALLTLILPPLLLKFLSRETYTVWVLILQVGAYTGLLNFGIQVAVGRFVAHYETTGEHDRRDKLISTAWASLLLAALLATVCVLVAALAFPRIFPHIPVGLRHDAQNAMALVGISMALRLPFSVFMGIFVGRQRYEIPGAIQATGRLLTAVALVWMAANKGTLIAMAEAFAAINVLTSVAQFGAFKRWSKSCRVQLSMAGLDAVKELWSYCLGLSVYNVAMLMVSGLDIVIVARLDFHSVAAYSIASGLVAFVVGLQGAVFDVLIPAGAILGAKADSPRLQQMLLNSTRYGVLLLMASCLPMLLWGSFLLQHYVGIGWVPSVLPLMQLLVVGNFIRLTAVPYAVLLIATDQQRLVLVTPFLEGVINLVSSIILGLYMGAAGVAIGTIIGAVAAISFNLFYNFPRTKLIVPNVRNYILQGMIRPSAVAVPCVVWGMFSPRLPFGTERLFLAAALVILAGVLCSFVCITPEERVRFSEIITKKLELARYRAWVKA